MNNACKVSFITVTYNGKDDTAALLESIYSAHFSFSFEVIVIDNASRVDEYNWLKQQYADIKGCRSARNLGFAGGNNLGIAMAQGEYLYFLNNDTLLPADAGQQIHAMCTFCLRDPTAGGITPKIKYMEPKDLLQFAGCTKLSPITLRNKQIGYREVDHGQYDQIGEIPYMHGAAMFVPAHVVKEIGMLPELYFLYYEELDWSCQIRQKYKLYYFPMACVFHKESASTGADSPLKIYYLTRNRIRFACRNRKGIVRFFSVLYLAGVANTAKFVTFICRGQWKQATSVWKGTRDAFHGLHPKKI